MCVCVRVCVYTYKFIIPSFSLALALSNFYVLRSK